MKTVSLSEISDSIEYGVTASANDEPVGPKFLRITDIQNGSVDWSSVPFCEADGRKLKSCRLIAGDIVFARTGATTGKSFLIRKCPENAVFASYLIRVRPSARVDSGFLAHFFDSPEYWSQITLKAAGAAQPGVNSSKLKELKIPLPPLDEQKRVAAILDQVQSLRRLRQGAIDRLSEFGQSVFHEMFERGTGRPFKTVPLQSLCRKITDGTHQAPKWADKGVPFIFVSNVRNQEISRETDKFVSDETYRELTKTSPIDEGDVLYTAVGSYGHAAVVVAQEPFLFQRHIAHIKPVLEKANPVYLSYCLESEPVRRQADRLAKGVAQKTVTLADLKKFEVPCPPLHLQHSFAQMMQELRSAMRAMVQHFERENDLFVSLQHRAFRGEL